MSNIKLINYLLSVVYFVLLFASCSNTTVNVLYKHIGYNSDDYCTITGCIYDEDTKEPLIGAGLYLLKTSIAASVDFNGVYKLVNIPPGKYSISVSYFGYGSIMTKKISLSKGETIEIDFFLKPEPMVIIEEKFLCFTKKDAIQDIRMGRYQIYDYYEKDEERIVNKVASRYGIVVKRPDEICMSFNADEYNNEMIRYLERRNGKNWFDRFMSDVKKRLKKK